MKVFGSKQVYENWMGGNLNDSLLYPGLILGFDKCDSHGPLENSRFTEFQVLKREDAVLYGKPFMNWTKQELFQLFAEQGIESTPEGGLCSPTVCFEMSFDEIDRLYFISVYERGY